MTPRFLLFEEIVAFHYDQVTIHGGMQGIRDKHLLESAINMPQATFGGEYLYSTLFEMAAVYAHGIIKNHPFCDGNKRTGILSMMMFLQYNGVKIKFTQEEFYNLAIDIATSKLSIEEIAHILKQHAKIKKS